MVPLMLTLALFAGDDDLTKAAKGVTAADCYTFTAESGPAGGAVEGKYRKGRPLWLKADKIEFFKKGDKLVYKHNDKWSKTKTGIESDPLIVLAASAKARSARAPHEELADLLPALKNPPDPKAGRGVSVYLVKLSEEMAKKLARSEDRDLARGGKATLTVDDKGRLTKYEIVIKVKGRRGNAEVDGETTKTVTLKDVGETKVTLPDEAKKLLE